VTCIWLVDDDPAVLRALQRLLSAEGLDSRAFPDPAAFLDAYDLGLPGLDGLALQGRLTEAGHACPVIFLSGQGSIPAAVRAIRGGAVDFLTKPVDARTLLATIRIALARDAEDRARRQTDDLLRARLSSLTPREREVMAEVVTGRLNKQIAERLGAAEKTIKVHRGRMMHKLGLRSVAELVSLWNRLHDTTPD
jgi:FixJ family two-component response regulator